MNPDKAPLGERLRNAILKPVDPGAAETTKGSDEPRSVAELEAAVKSADDKERIIGLTAAPIAAAIGFLIIGALIANDPSGSRHVSVSLYNELRIVLVGLSVLMLVMAMLRKRLYLGIVSALYGLAVFNLHYWGFGVPFVLIGSWYLVRAYRLQRDLRAATGGTSSRRGADNAARPGASKRYTPPTSPPKRSSPPKSEDERRAG
jgi:hypothetical protein